MNGIPLDKRATACNIGFSAMLAEEYVLIDISLSAAVRAEGTQNISTAESLARYVQTINKKVCNQKERNIKYFVIIYNESRRKKL